MSLHYALSLVALTSWRVRRITRRILHPDSPGLLIRDLRLATGLTLQPLVASFVTNYMNTLANFIPPQAISSVLFSPERGLLEQYLAQRAERGKWNFPLFLSKVRYVFGQVEEPNCLYFTVKRKRQRTIPLKERQSGNENGAKILPYRSLTPSFLGIYSAKLRNMA